MKTKKRHFINFDIAGFAYWEGSEVFGELKVGTLLTLMRETDNRFDPYAVSIYYGEAKIGYIPRSDNHEISKFLEMGYTSIFETRINRITPELHPANQIGVTIHLLEKKE
jgi:hypothetical protein